MSTRLGSLSRDIGMIAKASADQPREIAERMQVFI
jgi:hypothetical protein